MHRFIVILLLLPLLINAQNATDSTESRYLWQMPVPAATVGISLAFGASSHWVEPFDHVNSLVREETFMLRHYQNNDRYYTFDNYLQYLPVASLLAVKLCGVDSKHDFLQISSRAVMAWCISSVVNYPLKHTTDIMRPDRSSRTSFPSGHTATAFLGAEMLRLEYASHPIFPVLGYSIAAFTGFMRIYNDKHWFGDVLTGAAIGLISADVSYLLCSKIESFLQPKLDPKPLSQCQISLL